MPASLIVFARDSMTLEKANLSGPRNQRAQPFLGHLVTWSTHKIHNPTARRSVAAQSVPEHSVCHRTTALHDPCRDVVGSDCFADTALVATLCDRVAPQVRSGREGQANRSQRYHRNLHASIASMRAPVVPPF